MFNSEPVLQPLGRISRMNLHQLLRSSDGCGRSRDHADRWILVGRLCLHPSGNFAASRCSLGTLWLRLRLIGSLSWQVLKALSATAQSQSIKTCMYACSKAESFDRNFSGAAACMAGAVLHAENRARPARSTKPELLLHDTRKQGAVTMIFHAISLRATGTCCCCTAT